jgi:hypothetical protein
VRGETKTVTTTPAVVVSGAPVPRDRQSAIVKATSTNTQNIYVGGPNVDATAFILAPGDAINIDITNESLWALSAGGSQELRILRRGE